MVAVSYHCPRCGAVAELDRDAYLADRSVTPFPLEGWTYAAPSEDFEADEYDGVRFVCGDSDGAEWSHPPRGAERGEASSGAAGSHATRDADETSDGEAVGCGEPFYLNFVRCDDGEAVGGETESEYVELAERTAPSGPRGPSGPGPSP
jgi:hypothetical protein